jgi:polar amino acid transport system permease protein
MTDGSASDNDTLARTPIGEAAGRVVAAPAFESLSWWGIILVIMLITAGYLILTSTSYRRAFDFIVEGVWVTFWVSVVAYAVALVLGLIAGLGRVGDNTLFYTLSTLYVELVRGIPLIVQVIYVALVLVPLGVDALNLAMPTLSQLAAAIGISLPATLEVKGVGFAVRGMVGLAIGYGAYLAEVFRAGIESIPRGQMEASRSLGMTYPQAMRHVILPQAIRTVLPPLGNDFIAMLKDSALISVISARDITYAGRLYIARTFDTFTGWNTVVYLYLLMTLSLSLLVRLLERRTTFVR